MRIKICNLKFPGRCPGMLNVALDDEKGNPEEKLVCCNREKAARECKHGYYASITSESLEWPDNEKDNPDRTTIDHSKVGWK